MAAINLQTITIPTPEPYDDKDPDRQRENYHYVLLQMLTQAKANAEPFELGAATATLTVDLADLTQAVKDLAYNGQEIDLTGLLDGLSLIVKLTHRTVSIQTQ